jgi:hypothetical protein
MILPSFPSETTKHIRAVHFRALQIATDMHKYQGRLKDSSRLATPLLPSSSLRVQRWVHERADKFKLKYSTLDHINKTHVEETPNYRPTYTLELYDMTQCIDLKFA